VDGPSADADVALLDEVSARTARLGHPRLVGLPELVKVAANAFPATKISFINAVADVCEVANADVVKPVEALSQDERIGCKFINAGVGFGGGCLPKDMRAFMARARQLGADKALEFGREIDAINVRGRTRMVDLAREQRGSILVGTRVAVLVLRRPSNRTATTSATRRDGLRPGCSRRRALVTVHDPRVIEVAGAPSGSRVRRLGRAGLP
jgi:UDPglucose 6-dehydrogenase